MKMLNLVHLQGLRTPALIVLLLFMETILGTRFQCPPGRNLGITYSLLYLFLPALFLVISNLLLRSRRSSSLLPDAKSPIIWVFIVLLNEKFLRCLFDDLDYNDRQRIISYFQISALVLLVLCLMLEYYIPRLPSVQQHLQTYHRRQYQELVLCEIEVGVQEAANEKRKNYVQSLISPDLYKLIPEDPAVQNVILQVIEECQKKVQKGFTAEAKGQGAELKVQEEQSETQIPV